MNLQKNLTVLVVLTFLALSLSAEPIGAELGVEASTGDVLADGDFALGLAPWLGYTFKSLYVEAGLGIPVVPDATVESAYLTEEYSLEVSVIALTFGNTNSFYIDPEGDADGTLYVIAGYSLFSVELDALYLPDFALSSILAFDYEYDVAPGTIGAGVAANFALYEDFEVGDLELYVSYSVPAGPVSLTFEADPVIYSPADDPEFGLSFLVSAAYAF
ncbi:MAG: hypothetical protein JXB03_09610 [Spirochaetales bacterium]|nr:hypothetical protein [Spirochaetales bacterium]